MNAPATTNPATVPAVRAVAELVKQYRPVLTRLLARSGTAPATFEAQLGNAFRANPGLWACDPGTVLGAALRCAQLNLAPNDGTNMAWIIPYGRTATFQLGYGGVLELARRAVPGLMFDGRAVYPGDRFEIDYGNVERPIVHVPRFARNRGGTATKREPGESEAVAWYVRAIFPDGRVIANALDRAGVEYHRKFSKTPNGDLWTKSYDAAALKSVVLEMRRWLPVSPMLAGALESDGGAVDVAELDAAESEAEALTEVPAEHDD